MSVFFDTNVLVYLADNRDPQKQVVAKDLFKRAFGCPTDFWISVQTLTEFVNVALNKLKLSIESITGYLRFFDGFQIIGTDKRIVRRGLEIKSRYGLQYYDSVMLAAAERIGVDEIYSEDFNPGQIYCGIRAVNPFGIVKK